MQAKKRLLEAAQGKKATRPPIWMMRQAGRFLPEYRAIREKTDTLTMFRTPDLAAEITLQPLKRFALDAAIVYADILLIPDALGLGLSFIGGEGPVFKNAVRANSDLIALQKLWETTKEVSCWLKVRNFCAQENSKSRMCNYLKFIVLLGCRWMPVFPDLPERGATVSESCCYAGSVVTLGKLWSNQESQEMYVLYKCMWLVI